MTTYTTTGTLVTETKSFSEPKEPGLVDLVYSLNGQSITVDVVGSPGTADEEVVTQSLGGAADYPLAWQNAHTDFRLEATLSTSDTSVAPEVDSFSTGNLDAQEAVSGTISGDSTMSATAETPTLDVTATISGDATMTAAAVTDAPVDATISGDSTMTAAADIGSVAARGTIASDSTMLASARGFVGASITPDSTMSATATPLRDATISGNSTTTGSVAVVNDADASISGDSTMTASVDVVSDVDATAAADSTVSASASSTFNVQASIPATSTMPATATPLQDAVIQADSTMDATAELVVEMLMEADSGMSATVDTTDGVDASIAADSGMSAVVDTTDGVDASIAADSEMYAYVDTDKFGTLTTTRNNDRTITIDWTVVFGTRAFSAVVIERRTRNGNWLELARLEDPTSRTYTTDPLPDEPEVYTHRVRGIAADRVADTLEDSERYWGQQSAIVAPLTTSRRLREPGGGEE